MNAGRPKATKTYDRIINIGLQIAHETSIRDVTCNRVAERMSASHALVLHHLKTADNLRKQVAIRAIERNNEKIMRELIVINHPASKSIPVETKQRIIRDFQ